MIKIYSKPGCSQCVSAANLCAARGVDHKVLKIDEDYSLEDLQALTGQTRMNMPVVVVTGDELDEDSVTDYSGLLRHLKR